MSNAINNLNQGSPTTGSQIPFFDPSLGQDRRCSVSDILALQAASSAAFLTAYASPNASGYTVDLSVTTPASVTGARVYLILTPTASFANLTIKLPPGHDTQEVMVSTTQAVTGALSVTGATVGASPQPVNGAPTTLAAGGFFKLRFDGVNQSWYRVG